MKKRKKQYKIEYICLLIAALIGLSISEAICALFYTTIVFGVGVRTSYLIAASISIFISTFIGPILLAKTAKKILRPIIDIKDASKAVIDGDFETRLPEEGTSIEVNEIAHHFNKMVRELGNTEMFRNDFISNVSHEFKTPLSSIEGYATLLKEDLSKEEREEYIEYILNNTKRLTALTGNILMLSRMDNQEIMKKKENYLLDEQLCNVVIEYQEQWEKKNININMEVEKIEYCGYKALLYQVWNNLIQNAVKFTDNGGSIKVKCYKCDDKIYVSVIDNGRGMNKETIEHIFDKFYQADKSHNMEGNGLGLSLVSKIVSVCDGQIEVESEIEKGSRFTVIL